MLNKFFLRGIQSLKFTNTMTYSLNKFSVRALSKINKSKKYIFITYNFKDFCTNEQIINNTQENLKEDIASENAKRQANKVKSKKADNSEDNNNTSADKTENNKKVNTEKSNFKNESKNPMDFERKLKAVKDHLKNKSNENNEK